MIASELAAVSGFSAKEISDLATRGIIAGASGGGTKGKPRVFDEDEAAVCVIAREIIDAIGVPPADAFRVARHLAAGQRKFGLITISFDAD